MINSKAAESVKNVIPSWNKIQIIPHVNTLLGWAIRTDHDWWNMISRYFTLGHVHQKEPLVNF